jgi:hypothetical protein
MLDSYHWHEALDRTFCVQEMLDRLLSEHPVIEQDEELADQLEKVSAELAELYQMVGRKTPTDETG